MRIPPLSVWEKWPPSNYVDPQLHGPALLCINLIFITLVTVAVIGRFYSRIVVRRWFGLDDSMCILAYIFTIGMTTVVILANEDYGWDRHEWDIPITMIPAANKIAFVAKLMFTFAATFTRLSLLCFYYRLVKDSGILWFRWVLHASVALALAVCILFVCETVWLCIPIQSYWEFPPPLPYHCLNEGTVMLGGGVINCFCDLLTTMLPIPIVMKLQMPLRQRIGVCILLCLGFIVTIAGSIRTYFIWKSLIATWDETWYSYPLWIAAAVEIDLAVICACAPAWKSLLRAPLLALSSRVSSKLSYLRRSHGTTSSSPNSGASTTIFNPLRSLPWFQITTLEFERRRRRRSTTSTSYGQHSSSSHIVDLEKIEFPGAAAVMNATEPLPMLMMGPARREPGAREFRHSEICPNDDDDYDDDEDPEEIYGPDPRAPTPTPTLKISVRQSVEQEEAYIGPEVTLPPKKAYTPRRSIGSLLPGQWLGEGGSARKLLPRR